MFNPLLSKLTTQLTFLGQYDATKVYDNGSVVFDGDMTYVFMNGEKIELGAVNKDTKTDVPKKILPTRCKYCGAPLVKHRDSVQCEYCGTDYT